MATKTTPMHLHTMRRVYVFSLPLRLSHWINVASILVLCVTGYLIGNPPALQTSHEAFEGFWFGKVKCIHFVAAFVFFFNFVFRVYWLFAGNRFERWHNFVPTNKAFFKEMANVIKIDILQVKEDSSISLGHNSLAGLSYLMLFFLIIFQCLTGFALYAQMSDSWLTPLLGWVGPLLGGDAGLRMIHHILMWGFIVFAIVHVYLVFYHDYVEGRGEVSSIFGGWKFIEKDCIDKHDCTDFNK